LYERSLRVSSVNSSLSYLHELWLENKKGSLLGSNEPNREPGFGNRKDSLFSVDRPNKEPDLK
jgi:hypothetical protein